MPLVICRIHGRAGGELLSRTLFEFVKDRATWGNAPLVRPLTLAFEDIEFPGYMLDDDIVEVVQLGGVLEGSETYRFTDEEAMESAIGIFTATCYRCLRELIASQSKP
ncbi:hypothetical protein [Trinickia diaoshuihuensis]|uniref:hypothetical protein n=1 Tax=Trinickia diaoshuihuensis TaxID=2292265 RepID=UPI000E233DC4|nr:hypothetical protein [Trinickia diaoshuihuensis]